MDGFEGRWLQDWTFVGDGRLGGLLFLAVGMFVLLEGNSVMASKLAEWSGLESFPFDVSRLCPVFLAVHGKR
jgi:hypothetical protein